MALVLYIKYERVDTMTNLQRLQLEIQGISFTQEQMQVYLAENGLNHFDEYNAQSQASKRAIYKTALSILDPLQTILH